MFNHQKMKNKMIDLISAFFLQSDSEDRRSASDYRQLQLKEHKSTEKVTVLALD